MRYDVSHITYSFFFGVRGHFSVARGRTSCQAKVQDEMLVLQLGAWASEHKSDVGKVNTVSRHSSITCVLKEAKP